MHTTTANRTYRLDRTAYAPTTKRMLYRRYATVLVLAVILGGIMLAFMARNDEKMVETLPYTVPLLLTVMLASTVIGIRGQLVKQRAGWDSYELTIGPSFLVRRIVGLPSIEVLRHEVTSIRHAEGNGITVGTADAHRFIFVPEALVGFDEVKATLGDWRTIDGPPRGRSAITIARSALTLGCLFAAVIVPDIRLAIAAAVVFYVLVASSLREIAKTRVLTTTAKRRIMGGLLWMAIGPLARLLLHFLAGVDPKLP
jgi:hypothetical protein